jgi:hypothetical protein
MRSTDTFFRAKDAPFISEPWGSAPGLVEPKCPALKARFTFRATLVLIESRFQRLFAV